MTIFVLAGIVMGACIGTIAFAISCVESAQQKSKYDKTMEGISADPDYDPLKFSVAGAEAAEDNDEFKYNYEDELRKLVENESD